MDWYVVYTHPNAEAKTLAHLQRQGFEGYVPQCRKRRRHARRVEIVSRPLFPRYLFVCFDITRDRWRPILSTVGVSGMVRQGDDPIRVPEGVVEALRSNEAQGTFDALVPAQGLKAGDTVKVMDGPFADLIGQFCSVADSERVIVLLDFLGRQVSARIPASAVERAEDRD